MSSPPPFSRPAIKWVSEESREKRRVQNWSVPKEWNRRRYKGRGDSTKTQRHKVEMWARDVWATGCRARKAPCLWSTCFLKVELDLSSCEKQTVENASDSWWRGISSRKKGKQVNYLHPAIPRDLETWFLPNAPENTHWPPSILL